MPQFGNVAVEVEEEGEGEEEEESAAPEEEEEEGSSVRLRRRLSAKRRYRRIIPVLSLSISRCMWGSSEECDLGSEKSGLLNE
jgi:hypothetical protein